MQMTQIQLVECRTVGRQAVGRNRLWLDRLVVQKTSEQLQGRLCVPPALDNEVEDFALIVNRAPEVHPLPTDPADHLVEMPSR